MTMAGNRLWFVEACGSRFIVVVGFCLVLDVSSILSNSFPLFVVKQLTI